MRKLTLLFLTGVLLSGNPVKADEPVIIETATEAPVEDKTETTTENITTSNITTSDITMTYSEFMDHVDSNSSAFTSVDNDVLFKIMKNSIDAGEDVSLGDAFSKSTGLEIPSNLIYDISETGMTGHVDVESVNFQYAQMAAEMNTMEKQYAEDMSKNAMTAKDYFIKTYGDIGSTMTVERTTLPDGVSFSAMCINNRDQLNKLYIDAFDSSDYQAIRSNLNVSGLFDQASQGLSEPGLMSAEELSNLTSSYSNKLKQSSLGSRNKSKTDLYNKYLANKSSHEQFIGENGVYDPTGQLAAGQAEYDLAIQQNELAKHESESDPLKFGSDSELPNYLEERDYNILDYFSEFGVAKGWSRFWGDVGDSLADSGGVGEFVEDSFDTVKIDKDKADELKKILMERQ